MVLSKKAKFILAIAIQTAIILFIVIFKVAILTGGTEVFLKIKPVDPRDWLRGDYVTFNYDISTPNSYLSSGEKIYNGDTVYVTLREGGEYWLARNVSKSKPTGNEIFIKGKVKSGGISIDYDFAPLNYTPSNLRIEYGIEQYFIPEGAGQNFSFFNKEAVAKVAVDKDGNAVLKQIYVDDKPWP